MEIRSVADLKPGQKGVISSLVPDELTLKLMEMGCLPGAAVEVRHVAPFGDPMCIRIEGYQLSLRRQEAATLLIDN